LSSTRHLGVHIDSQLTMSDHISAVCCSCFFPAAAVTAYSASIDRWRCEDTCTRVRQQSSWLLQQSACQYQWLPATEASTCPECRCPLGDWHVEVRTHLTSAQATSLVTHPSTDTIQGRCTGPQVSTRRRSTVSCWPLCTSVVVLQPLPAAVNWRWSTVRPADTDKLLSQKFCCMRPDSLEQSAC